MKASLPDAILSCSWIVSASSQNLQTPKLLLFVLQVSFNKSDKLVYVMVSHWTFSFPQQDGRVRYSAEKAASTF
jgi:hypothetical protein